MGKGFSGLLSLLPGDLNDGVGNGSAMLDFVLRVPDHVVKVRGVREELRDVSVVSFAQFPPYTYIHTLSKKFH